MRIAVCLHGQPRDYSTGYKNLSSFLEANSEHTFDFFLHAWIDSKKMDCSPWRYINPETLLIKDTEKVKKDLLEFYKPTKYEFQESIKEFAIENLEESISYKNHSWVCKGAKKLENKNNVFSQFYSRNKVRNLLDSYIKDSGTTYDFVICTRIDFFLKTTYKLKTDTSKVYVNSTKSIGNRIFIGDYFIVSPTKIYLQWFNIYENLKYILNNEELNIKMKKINEPLHINVEELILANFIYHFDLGILSFEDMIFRQ